MWTTPVDRAQAERRARMTKMRTPAQQKRRAARETAFHAGFDQASFFFADKIGVPIDLGAPRHLVTRREAYAEWEYREDRD